MKNITLILTFVLFSFVALADVGPVGRSSSDDNTGSLQSGSLEKWYVNVKNTSGVAASDGAVMIAETTEDDGYSVTTGSAAASVPVCIMAKSDGSTCADDEVCRCQTYGLNSGVIFDSTNVAASAGGLVFVSESTVGYVEAEGLVATAATDWPIGVFLDDVATSQDAEVFIRLR